MRPRLLLVSFVCLACFASAIFLSRGQESDIYARKRRQMVAEQLAGRDISDAAVLAELEARVFSIEINPRLAEQAARTVRELGYRDIRVKSGDGFFGWPEEAPFDGVIVTCASPRIPPLLVEQLNEGGPLIIPLGVARQSQVLTLAIKTGGRLRTREISGVRFVPMTGEAQKKKRG